MEEMHNDPHGYGAWIRRFRAWMYFPETGEPWVSTDYEMYERGFKFLPVDLYKSHATKFKIEDGAIRPPFNSIAGLGNVAAESLYDASQEEEFMSIDEVRQRGKIGNSVIDVLKKFNCLKGLPESNQLSLFG